MAKDKKQQIAVAKDCLKKAKGNLAKATELMMRRVKADEVLYRLFLDPFLQQACYTILGEIGRHNNDTVWRGGSRSPYAERQGVIVYGEGLLGWMLLGRIRLGDATKADLEEGIRHYRAQSDDMAIKAAWLSLIDDQLPKGAKVKDAFTAIQLEHLQEQARRGGHYDKAA